MKYGLPDLIDCPSPLCADGKAKNHTCATCNGLGKVDAETGEAIAPEVGYPALRAIIRVLRQRCLAAETRVKALEPEKETDPYRDVGTRYGTTWRMD